jgi:hypothetical protein
MGDRSLRRLAWALCAITLLVLAASLILILLGWSAPLPRAATPWRDRAIALIGIVGAPILGGLIASRRPRNPYGWVWLGFGLGLALAQLESSISAYARVVESGTLVATLAVAHVLRLGNQVSLVLAPFLLLLFPTGRLPSRRWRPVAWISALSGAMIMLLVLIFGSPDKVGGVISFITVGVVFVIFATIALSALSLLVRYRRASGVEQQQLKWVAFAAVLAATTLMAQQLFWLAALLNVYVLDGELPTSNPSFENLREAATNVCLYAGVGIAILRYRLYDIDVIINRTLVYGSLTLTLALVYFGGVASAQALFRALTGQERLSQLAVVVSTLAIAALFDPLRRRIQSVIDRRFYRRKYDAAKTLESFSTKLRDETNLDELSGDLVRVVRDTMQPEHVSLWLRPGTSSKRGQWN